MHFGNLVGSGSSPAYEQKMAMDRMANANQPARPRTIREQLEDQIAHHKAKIADLEAACEALTPDVEKALDALQKLA